MRKRILTNYIITLLLSALITGALAFYFIKYSYKGAKEDKLLTSITLIENILIENYKDVEDVNFYRLTQEFANITNYRVTFIDMEGRPIADSINNSIILKKQILGPEFRNSINRKLDVVRRYSVETGDIYFYLASPPIKIGSNEVILRLGDTYDEVDDTIERFLSSLTTSTFVGVCIAIIIAYISIGKIIKPIKELTKASKLIADGDFDSIIAIDAKDEIEELSLSFNQMSKRLQSTINRIKEKNTELDAVLSSLEDGILALDLNKKVVLVNSSVNKILGISRKINLGEDINQVLGDLENINIIEDSMTNSTIYYEETEILDKTKIISLTTYPIVNKEEDEVKAGTLIIIRDITSIKNLERMRKDFVANVSHELRTPLTSIGGFIETLKTRELDENSREKALNIMELETERLKVLINELLNLSRIESIKEVKQVMEVDLEDEVYQVLGLLEPQSKDKNIGIEIEVEAKLNKISVNTELLRQMLINLIENSIKYNKPYGKVHIEILNHEEGIKLIIEDDGIGIPEEDLQWIFGRFYRVDKSRSNNIGGTGLGLSIVKHIVLNFGGSIEVESELGKGSKFIVVLPR